MEWSAQQSQALQAVDKWLKTRDKQVFKLWGYAGTGKTTLAKHLAANLDGLVLFAAFTGKAASVMLRNGCKEATTIHSLIYKPKEKSRARLRELEEKWSKERPGSVEAYYLEQQILAEKKRLRSPHFELNEDSRLCEASLLVIDECSMVDGRIGADLISFGVPILVLGDPAQLPPVFGFGFFTTGEPDITLTEIHRQARDNPIIDLATRVRRGERLPKGEWGSSSVVARACFDPDAVGLSTQVIVGRNATRRRANARIRKNVWGSDDLLVAGERLICLRNNQATGVLNGTLWKLEVFRSMPEDHLADVALESEDGMGKVVTIMDLRTIRGEEKPPWKDSEIDDFDYGYAITAHKAQGSQWKDVVVVDESSCFRREENRWLYTAITRAEEKVVVVQ